VNLIKPCMIIMPFMRPIPFSTLFSVIDNAITRICYGTVLLLFVFFKNAAKLITFGGCFLFQISEPYMKQL
jgi:hypothetical protein